MNDFHPETGTQGVDLFVPITACEWHPDPDCFMRKKQILAGDHPFPVHVMRRNQKNTFVFEIEFFHQLRVFDDKAFSQFFFRNPEVFNALQKHVGEMQVKRTLDPALFFF
ncbi:hypothetical protein D3C86_1857730 [compost metagenome]